MSESPTDPHGEDRHESVDPSESLKEYHEDRSTRDYDDEPARDDEPHDSAQGQGDSSESVRDQGDGRHDSRGDDEHVEGSGSGSPRTGKRSRDIEDGYDEEDQDSKRQRLEQGHQGRRRQVVTPAKHAESVPPSNVLGAFGISYTVNESILSTEFGKYGTIEKIVVPRDRTTSRPRGYAFIYFSDVEGATAARDALNGYELEGRPIRVDYSKTRDAHAPTPGVYMGEKRDRDRERPPRGGGYGRGYGRGPPPGWGPPPPQAFGYGPPPPAWDRGYGGREWEPPRRYGDRYGGDRYGGDRYGDDRYDDRYRDRHDDRDRYRGRDRDRSRSYSRSRSRSYSRSKSRSRSRDRYRRSRRSRERYRRSRSNSPDRYR